MKTHLSLFSGIGGLDLAAEWAGFITVGQCEWADYPTQVLEKHWPNVPRWRDIRTLTGESFYEKTGRRTVDIISGGFPCQPFSVAGKQRGKEDDRYLWPEMVRVIKELRPTWIIGENVAGIVKMALPDILSELEDCGYRTRTFLVPACAVGARHRRYRVAIVGYSEHYGLYATEVIGSVTKTSGGQQKREKTSCKFERAGKTRDGETLANSESQHERRLSFGESKAKPGFVGGSENIQHSDSAGCKEQHSSGKPDKQGLTGGGCDAGNVCHPAGKGLPDGTGQQMGGYGTPEPESERPDSNVSDTDNGSRLMRRDGEFPAVEKTGRERSNIGNRTEKHEPRQRWSAQPGLGGVAARFSDRMDGGVINGNEQKNRTGEDLPDLRGKDDTKEIQRSTGRFRSVQQESILQQGMYGERLCEIGDNTGRGESEEQKICKRPLRDVRNNEESSSAPYRHEPLQQCAGEYHDTLPIMSHEIPLGAWKIIDKEVCDLDGDDALNFIINHYWDTEPDIPRVTEGIKDRVGRLKALGNAVVPQQFYLFFKAIADVMKKEMIRKN